MQIKKKDIKKVFSKLNLKVRSTKHNYGWLLVNSQKILRVHYSHGRGDIPTRIAQKIRSQLKLNETDFFDLINCPLNLDGYLEILHKKGYI